MCARAAILVCPPGILPSEVERDLWTRRIWRDTSMLGDCLCGTWDVFIVSPIKLESLRQACDDGASDNIAALYTSQNFNAIADVGARFKTVPIPNSNGNRINYLYG